MTLTVYEGSCMDVDMDGIKNKLPSTTHTIMVLKKPKIFNIDIRIIHKKILVQYWLRNPMPHVLNVVFKWRIVFGTDGRLGWCLELKTSTFKPCHVICQLGSALDNIDVVEVEFLKPTFRLIAHPYILVRTTNERWIPTLVATSGS